MAYNMPSDLIIKGFSGEMLEARKVTAFFKVTPILMIALLLLKGFLVFPDDWDWLAYHLPFALKHFHLTSFVPLKHLEHYYQGFPPLVHYIQGIFIWTTGSFTGGAFANLIALMMLVLAIRITKLQIDFKFLALLFLGIPHFITHLPSGYIDFFVACSLASAFTYTVWLLNVNVNFRNVFIVSMSYLIAMTSKYQTWPFIAIMSFTVILRILISSGKLPGKIMCAALVAIFVGAFPIRNLVQFGNPSHPIATPIIGRYMANQPAPFSRAELCAQMPPGLCDMSAPGRFFTSAFELTRLLEPGLLYTVDQGPQRLAQSPHFRIGGWFVGTVLFLLASLLVIFRVVHRSRGELGLLAMLVLPLFITPANHELRYWMFVPMTMAICVAKYFTFLGAKYQKWVFVGSLLCAVFVCWDLRKNFVIKGFRGPADIAPTEAKDYWLHASTTQSECIIGKTPKTIYWAGPTFSEFPVSDCTK